MEYKCNHCNKNYASYQSRCNHIRRYHKSLIPHQPPEDPPEQHQNTPKNKCNFCNIIFSRKDSLNRHINKNRCKKEKTTENKIEKMQKEIENLKNLLQKALKIHPKTLKKINNELNNNNINSNNTTNNTINNNLYVQLGREDLVNVLSGSEKRAILNRKAMGINDLVELIHGSGKYKQFMNVYITNLQNTVAYCYNEKLNNFIAVNKNELLNDIIDCRMYDIQKFFDEAEHYLNPKTSADIKRIIKKMDDDETFKGIKKEEIKFILYNNKDKILAEKNKCISDNEVKSMVENNIEL